eukprot:scaffold8.g1400.t1
MRVGGHIHHTSFGPAYNIRFWGIENLHPFDSKKFQHIVRLLERDGVLAARQLAEPALASQQILADVHTQAYLDKLNTSSLAVAWVCELPVLAFLPSFVTRRKVLHPMATMAALRLSGGAVPLLQGGGWCTYADPYLAIRRLREASGGLVKRVLVVDLDGNGIERCKLHFQDQDGIDVRRELGCGTGDEAYLEAVEGALRQAFEGQPRFDLLLYNAGTDVLEGDPLGRLRVSTEGVRRRDELVWAAALEHGTPIVQVLSGGYTRASTPCIAASIASLFRRFGLGAAAAAGAGGGVLSAGLRSHLVEVTSRFASRRFQPPGDVCDLTAANSLRSARRWPDAAPGRPKPCWFDTLVQGLAEIASPKQLEGDCSRLGALGGEGEHWELHIDIGRALAPLRDEGVLLVGSGFSFHNMPAFFAGPVGAKEVAERSGRFDSWLGDVLAGEGKTWEERRQALEGWAEAPDARYCHPREEHLLPLMVAFGAGAGDPGKVVWNEVLMNAVSSSVQFG